MRVDGSSDLAGSPAEVFPRLLDAEVLRRCIPGCEALEELGPNHYALTVKGGVGALRGTFRGEVRLHDVVEPERYRMTIRAKSRVGRTESEARVRLEAVGDRTRIHYEAEAHVTGLMAAVGGSLLQLAVKKQTAEMFERLAAEIASRR